MSCDGSRFTDIVAFEKENGTVNSFIVVGQPVSEPGKISWVNLVNKTVYHMTTRYGNPVQKNIFRANYITVTEDKSVLLTTAHGLYMVRYKGQFKPIININNYLRHRDQLADHHVDGNLTTAILAAPRRLVPVPGYSSIFVFIDFLTESLRVIDLAAKSVYTLCQGDNNALLFHNNIPLCDLSTPYSLLLENMGQTYRIIVATDHMLLQAEINVKGMIAEQLSFEYCQKIVNYHV